MKAIETRLRAAARAANLSQSRWVANLIAAKLHDEWPAVVATLPFGLAEARRAAQIRAALEVAGTPIGPYDVLIAATALAHGGTLVTHNVQEFDRVAGLPLVDWYT